MNDHNRSEKARACVRKYVEQHTQLIEAWLEGSGTLEEVGAELISSEVEKFLLNGEPDLLHLPLTPHEPMPTFAFPFSPPEMERGELYEFCLHHIMTLDDPMSAFRLDVTET